MSTRHRGGRQSGEIVRAHVVASGRVQGVFFRAEMQREAIAHGVAGWVRNSGDDVEAVLEGALTPVEKMIRWCHDGSPRSAVEHVSTRWEEPEGLIGFDIAPTRY